MVFLWPLIGWNRPIRSHRNFNTRYFPKSSVARNYHGWKFCCRLTEISESRLFRDNYIFGYSITVSTNHITSWLKSTWFGFYEFLELDRMTNVSSLTTCESSLWVINNDSLSIRSHIYMTHVSEWLIISQYCDLRVSWSANHISPEICFIWPLIGQNFIWSILIGQMQNGQFLLVKTDLLDDYITVSRNTSNTDFNNESYCINHKWWVISMMHSLWLIIIQSELLKSFWL